MPYLLLGCRVLVGLVFAVAAVGKLRGRAGFATAVEEVRRLRVVPDHGAVPTALAVAASELAVPLLLCLPGATVAGFGLAAVLLAVFTAALGRAQRHGWTGACQCFGQVGGGASGRHHLVRNALLGLVAVTGGALAAAGAPGGHPAGLLLAAFTGAVCAALAVASADLADLFRAPSPVDGFR